MTLLANGAVGRSSDFGHQPLEACTQAIREHTEYPVGLPSPHYLCARNCRVELLSCVDKIVMLLDNNEDAKFYMQCIEQTWASLDEKNISLATSRA